ncbi:hypothetical protein [Pandoraea pulmonicola]|uniref:Phage infection protein n=1 Tax=Pandoraea pulmonicola TaxID=93221 RepID=A0AAJ4ZCN2_PANPU|nr:hypothetical protein [Pandoraea pulmonicola]AJC20595.1 hypothetical protein RO07_09135 [Pandoraea pulmonicola]SUA90943.1 Uncharacterised protein [Pandoraea pulmonicola]
MNVRKTLILSAVTVALGGVFASQAFAQGTATETARDVNQQQRIENGLKSGQLTTGEASRLEKGEAKIDRMQAHADHTGDTAAQKGRIARAQNRESAKIGQLEHNGAVGNPASVSSQRMQADVQRNVNQEKRIAQGQAAGTLNKREVGSLERGQAHVDAAEARAGKNGHVSAAEQAGVQHRENHQSQRIRHDKTNG